MVAAAVSIVLSWLYMNMIFALHYAHGYTAAAVPHKGLEFPGTPEPDYWDFAYFALVLGMTFQVSDVQIVNRRLRRGAGAQRDRLLLQCLHHRHQRERGGRAGLGPPAPRPAGFGRSARQAVRRRPAARAR